jgi:hypothetical protein
VYNADSYFRPCCRRGRFCRHRRKLTCQTRCDGGTLCIYLRCDSCSQWPSNNHANLLLCSLDKTRRRESPRVAELVPTVLIQGNREIQAQAQHVDWSHVNRQSSASVLGGGHQVGNSMGRSAHAHLTDYILKAWQWHHISAS